MRNQKLIIMIEGAIIAGVCVALSYIPLNTTNADFDISLGLIPLGVYALRRGAPPALAVGLIWGLLLILLGKAFILSVPQVILEYPVAFAFGGLGGLFCMKLKRLLQTSQTSQPPQAFRITATITFAALTATVARWFFRFWAGVIFWGGYAPENMNPYLWSFLFNGASALANAVVVAVVLTVLVRTAPRLFKAFDA